MTIKALTLPLCFVAVSGIGQLVNGSFESHTSIPTSMGQWQVAPGWGNAGSTAASPDYYHYDGNMVTDLPETPMAMVDAQQGDAVMGLAVCGRSTTNIREYLSAQFSNPLVPGKRYMVGFKITNGIKTASSLAGLGVDQLGLCFTQTPLVQSGQAPIMAVPQLKIESVVYNENWQSVNFIIIPEEPFEFMTFGLFGDDSDKNITVFEGVDPAFAYYFVDNFVLEEAVFEIPINGGGKEPADPEIPGQVVIPALVNEDPFFVPNTFTPNSDQSNDVFRPISNTVQKWQLEVFSKWGDRVYATADKEQGWDGTYNGMNCSNGSYVWQITYTIDDDNHQPRKVESRGIVNLIR